MSQLDTERSADQAIDTLRLDDDEWRALVGELDRITANGSSIPERREHERVAYRNSAFVFATIEGPDQQPKRYKIRTHDLSAGGIGFLHGTFIYPGSKVQVVLRHQTQGAVLITGAVRRCDHLTRHIHHVGVQFDELIEPEHFLLAM